MSLFKLLRVYTIVTSVSVAATVLQPGVCPADDAALIAGILKSWEARQARVKSLRADWTVKVHLEPGTQLGKDSRPGVFPPAAVDSVEKETFFLDGDQWRDEFGGLNWSDEFEQVIPQRRIHGFDGRDFRQFFALMPGAPPKPVENGSIRQPEASFWYARHPRLAPLLAAFRPLAPKYGHFSPETWDPNPKVEREVVGGEDCVVIDFVDVQKPKRTKRCWVAPNLENAIVRLRLGEKQQLDIEYDVDGEHGPIPLSWKWAQFPEEGDKPVINTSVAAAKVSINAKIDPALLTLEFPPGVPVTRPREPQGR